MSDKEENQLEGTADGENRPLIDAETASPAKRKLTEEKEEEATVSNTENNKRKRPEDSPATEMSQSAVVKKENPNVELSDEIVQSSNVSVKIKSEPVEANDENDDHGAIASTSSVGINTVAPKTAVVVKTEAASSSTVVVKTEPMDNSNSTSAVADSSVSSSTLRPSCRFGIRCYRRNPAHRRTEAHPGDSDYRRPSYPTPPLGTPPCAFGNVCYRRNPLHFQQFSHPPDFNSAQNIRNRLRQRRRQTQNTNGGAAEYSDLESDEEDPFHDQGDSDLDYNPDAHDDKHDDDEDDDLEFNSERQNCDVFD